MSEQKMMHKSWETRHERHLNGWALDGSNSNNEVPFSQFTYYDDVVCLFKVRIQTIKAR